MSIADKIAITAHYSSLVLNLKDSESALLDRNYPEHMREAAKKASKQTETRICGLVFKVPITRFKFESIQYVLLIYENYERGVMPFPGSFSEQPAQIVEMISLIQFLKSELQQKLEKGK